MSMLKHEHSAEAEPNQTDSKTQGLVIGTVSKSRNETDFENCLQWDSTCYKPLMEKDEIRLLVIEPGLPGTVLKCWLSHVLFRNSPKYEALSYMWGAEDQGWKIMLDGKHHLVRENLYHALHAMRRPQETRVMWIDALCINQKDDKERGHQVNQMSNIYQKALEVCAWLGPYTYAMENAFASLQNLDANYVRKFEDVIQLWHSPYWSRLWIIQELALASKVVLHCGRVTLPWSALATILESTSNHVHSTSIRQSIWYLPLSQIYRQRISYTRKLAQRFDLAQESLLWLLREHHKARCADVRDKIFGLVSFASPCCREANPVDYSVPEKVLYRRLLEHEIQYHGRNPTRAAEVLYSCLRDSETPAHLSESKFLRQLDIGQPAVEDQYSSTLKVRAQEDLHFDSLKVLGRIQWISPPIRDLFTTAQALNFPRQILRDMCQAGYLSGYPYRLYSTILQRKYLPVLKHAVESVMSFRDKDSKRLVKRVQPPQAGLIDLTEVERLYENEHDQNRKFRVPDFEYYLDAFGIVTQLLEIFRLASRTLKEDETMTNDCVFFYAGHRSF